MLFPEEQPLLAVVLSASVFLPFYPVLPVGGGGVGGVQPTAGHSHVLPPVPQLQARAPGEGSRLADYCAGAMFVQQLLSQGYGFDERAFGGVTFQKKVGDGGSGRGWAGPPAPRGG